MQPSPSHSERCRARADRAWERCVLEPEPALQDAQEALELARDQGDPELLARVEASQAYVLRWLGRVDEAQRMASAVLDRSPPLVPRLRALAALAEASLLRGTWAQSGPVLDEALSLAAGRSDVLLERGRLENLLGRTHFERFEHAQAERAFSRSTDLYRQCGDGLGVATGLMNIGNVRSRLSDFDGALESYRQSLAALEGQADAGRRPMLQYNLALVFERLGDLRASRELCEDALSHDLSRNPYCAEALLLMQLGRVHGLMGELASARPVLDRALHLAAAGQRPDLEAALLAQLGDLELLTGDADKARDAYHRSLGLLGSQEASAAGVQCLHGLARAHLARGETAEALGLVDALLEGSDDRPDRTTRLEILQTRVRTLEAAGDPDAADEGRRAVERLRRLTLDEDAAARVEHLTLLNRLERTRTREERLAVRVDEQDARLAEAAAERAELLEQLRISQRMEAIGRLAAGVAHDFNNLLTVIIGHTEELRHAPGPEALREASDGVLQAAERATDLTQRLLAFSRHQVLHPQAVSLDDVVRELAPVLERLAGPDVHLELSLDGAAGMVLVDHTQLEQVLLNLVSNAADAMPSGGRLELCTARVRVDGPLPGGLHELAPGDFARLAVTDSGVGIPRELHARIFEPFFSTKEMTRGTGLGLATVYGVARQSGGGLAVHSEPGRGCTLEVFLPLAEACQVGAAGDGSAGGEPPAQSRVVDVLLVEDDDALRQVVAKGLRRLGLEVTEASDGEEALELVRRGEAEAGVVVADLVMPRLGGRELLERLREHRPDLRCVFTSGHRERGEVVQVPGVSWLPKPFAIAELARLVRGHAPPTD